MMNVSSTLSHNMDRLHPRHRDLLILVPLFLLVAAIGARLLNDSGVWFDEWWSWYNAGASYFTTPLSPVEIWTRIAIDDPWQTPGYPWMLSAWGNLVGWTEFASRSLSLLAGVLSVAVIYPLGRILGGRRVALAAAVLMGTSGWLLYFVHEMRVYTIYILLTELLFLLYLRIMRAARVRRIEYTAFLMTASMLLYTHYFAAIPVAVVGILHIIHLLRKRPDRRWFIILILLGISGLLLLPWLENALRAMSLTREARRNATAESVQGLIGVVGEMIYAFSNGGAALFAVVALFGLRSRTAWRSWVLLGLILLGNIVAYRVFIINELRYGMTMIPFMAIVAGFGLVELAKRRIPAALIVGIWIGGMLLVQENWAYNSVLQRTLPQPMRQMADLVMPYARESDVVINAIGGGLASAVQGHPFVHYFGDTRARLEIVELETLPSTQAYAERVRQAVGDVERVWVAYSPRWASSEWSLFTYLLNQGGRYECARLADDDDMRVVAYGRVDDTMSQFAYPIPEMPDLAVRLQRMGELTLHDDHLPVWLGFSIDAGVPPETYSVAVHLVDSAGTLRAQSDFGLPFGAFEAGATKAQSCRMTDLPTIGLSSGEYTVRVILYDWRSGVRLSGSGSGETGDALTLGTITLP